MIIIENCYAGNTFTPTLDYVNGIRSGVVSAEWSTEIVVCSTPCIFISCNNNIYIPMVICWKNGNQLLFSKYFCYAVPHLHGVLQKSSKVRLIVPGASVEIHGHILVAMLLQTNITLPHVASLVLKVCPLVSSLNCHTLCPRHWHLQCTRIDR